MKPIALSLGAILFLAGWGAPNFWQPSTEKAIGDVENLTHLKTVLWPQAYREHDTALLDALLAEEFVLISMDGAWSTKEGELAYLKKKARFPESFVFHIHRLDVFENGTAIVAGTGEIRDSDGEGRYVFTYHSSNVLLKRAGRWLAVASHTSNGKRVSEAEFKGVSNPHPGQRQ